jgi:uncharacterized OB-fold protein
MPESVVKEYYEHLKDGRLIGRKCNACGGYTFPPTTACEHCGSMDLAQAEFSGKGRLLYVTHSIAPPPNPRFFEMAPYAYGHVKLEEGVFVQAIIVGVDIDPENLKKLYDKGPVDVAAQIIEVEGLPILAFKIV